MDPAPGRPLTRDEIVHRLDEARARTLLLVAGLSDDDLTRQHDPLMSPIVWDLGHIAHFEEVWLLENVEAGGGGSEGLHGLYNPFEHPRADRGELPLPGRDEVLDRLAAVRRSVVDRLWRIPLDADTPLLRDGFVFRMVLQHEYQHDETILQALQLKKGAPYRAPRRMEIEDPEGAGGRAGSPSTSLEARGAAAGSGESGEAAMVRFPGGEVEIGTDDRSEAYDNERPRHPVALDPFLIDRTPVTNGRYLAFMQDGGYARPELWSDAGWTWLQEAGVEAPKYWFEEDGAWRVRVMDRVREVDATRPVCHVTWYEADAFARWAGNRLPTEFEWEAAAVWDPERGRASRFPWGDHPATPDRANVDQATFDTAPVDRYPENVSPIGCYGMIGDVWEWTSTDFHGYPGYETFPYPEYSEDFFGDDFKVLRGGSWATRSGAIRGTFRNWDYPMRRQIFSGFRCARDV